MKLTSIIRFEFFYNVKKTHTYLFFFLLIFQGVWYTTGVNDLFANNDILLNAPAVAYRNLALMGIILFAITAIISSGSLARDLESNAAHILYPAMVHEKKYFLGKYTGAVLVNLLVVLGYPLGILLFPLLGMGAPEQFGPVPLGQLLHGFLLLTLPNMVFLITFSIFLVVMFRRAAAAYLGVLLIFILFMVSVSVRDNSVYRLGVELLDPFGYCCVERITDAMDVVEFNTAYLPVSTPLLLNRLIWVTVCLFLFSATIFKFNFKTFVSHPARTARQKKETAGPVSPAGKHLSPSLDNSPGSSLVKSLTFARTDFKHLLVSPVFLAVMATLFLMFLGYNFLWTSTYYLTTSHLPLTSAMTFIRIPMMLVIAVMLLILSGEVLFKDRAAGVWQIVDAMPTPSWVFVLSRWLTMGGLALVISSLMFVAGLLSQWGMGFTDIEWSLYIRELYGSRFGWLTCLQIISLAFFCGTLFSSRLKGHIVSIALFIFITMSVDHKLIEQLHYAFPIVPAVLGPEMNNYSEMNGYGVLDTGLAWYTGAWTSLAALLMMLCFLLWNRGVARPVKERWQVVKRRLQTPGGKGLAAAMLLCLSLFGCFQYGIHDNLVRKAGYQTEAGKETAAAAYEKRYAQYRETPRPKMTDLDLDLDLFPARRQAVYTARLVLQNKTARPMETLHLDWDRKLTMERPAADNRSLDMLENDARVRHAIYRVRPALEPGGMMDLTIKATLAYKGFHQSEFQGDLTYNGTVLGTDFLPSFGYDRSRELVNNKKRLRQGLDLLDSRMDRQDTPFSKTNRFESVGSDGLNWDIRVSTDGDQTLIGPGEKIFDRRDNGRTHARFRSRHPGAMNFKIISARLVSRTFDCLGVSCGIFHDPRHTYNLDVFRDAVEKAVPWLSEKLGPCPHDQLSVVEKPFYDEDFITFANVTAISENRGWTADINTPEDGQYIYQAVAGELAKQWLDNTIKAADVQGAQLLTESIARYYAFRFMDDAWGSQQTAKWLDRACEDYEKGRSKEAIEENPLVFADRAAYLSREKGGLALYALARRTGPEAFDRWLGNWIAGAGRNKEFLTSADFYSDLKNFIPEALHPFARDWFEKRIQYRLSLVHVQTGDGKLVLAISGAKQEQDGNSGIGDIPFSIPLEVGLTDESGNIQAVRQIRIQPGESSYDLGCAFVPAAVILDPYRWYLIQNRPKCSQKL